MFNKNKIGLVLGGGGARGFFHMGVIKAIQELGIEISEISGTSIGAIIGAIYAANPNFDFEKASDNLNFAKLIQAMSSRVTTRDHGDKFEIFLKNFIGADEFSDLKIPLRINATDINNRKEIVFEKGNLFPGLIASISIPGVFSPVKYQDSFLVDGGMMNNVPISLIKNAKKIIVSDITGPIKKITEKSLSTDILYSSVALLQQSISLEKAKSLKHRKIIYLDLEDDNTFILDFRKKNYQTLINLGYKTAMEKLK